MKSSQKVTLGNPYHVQSVYLAVMKQIEKMKSKTQVKSNYVGVFYQTNVTRL